MATITSPSTDALLRERALGQVARLLADRVGADAAMVSVLTDDGRLDHVRAGTGIEAVLRNDARFVRRAIRSDRILVKRVPPQDGPGGLTCIVAAPIQVPSMVAGAVTAGFSEPPVAPVDSLTWMLEAHAALAGLCLGDPDGVRRLLTAAETDDATGCLPQTRLKEELGAQINRSDRGGAPLSCWLIALDDFELVDLLVGPPAGDQVLRLVGRILSHGVRSCDAVARYGSDEFAVVLPDADLDRAMTMAARLQVELEQATSNALGSPLSSSIGTAEWIPGWSPDDLLQNAASALITAKRPAGNRIVAAPTPRQSRRSSRRPARP